MTTFNVATDRDDSDLRALLRENAMPSWVTMTVEREPSFFAGMNRFGRDSAIMARQRGQTVGMGTCSIHPVHVNGLKVELGYLGALRVNPAYRNRIHLLRESYAAMRNHGQTLGIDSWYTCIATLNDTARRLLEANLKGMPRYIHVGELVTLAMAKGREQRNGFWQLAAPEDLESLIAFHNNQAGQYQFAPALSSQAIQTLAIPFYVHKHGNRIDACMALWNQQGFKQVVARSYRQPLAALLPFYNGFARLRGKIALPRIGSSLDQSFLAFLAIDSQQPRFFSTLLQDALALCNTRVLTVGLHAKHPWLEQLIKRFRPSTYQTGVYTVSYDQEMLLDGRPVQPEVAIL